MFGVSEYDLRFEAYKDPYGGSPKVRGTILRAQE